MKFKKEFLIEVLESGATVHTEMIGRRRWSIDYSMVFAHEGKYYQTHYSVGATESQDESPFEYDPDEIECVEVRPVQKTITEYVTVSDG